AEFGYGLVLFLAAGFLSEAREGGAEQALNLGIVFLRQFLGDQGQGVGHNLVRRGGVKVGELGQADGSLATGVGILGIEATTVVGENFRGELVIVAIKKDFHKLTNVARRHAGCLTGEQNAFFASLGNLGPEHAVENVGMGLNQDTGLGHFIFLDAQDLAERVHLPAHVLHHVVDGVDLDFAALIAVEGEFNRHGFSRLHQKRGVIAAVGVVLRSLLGQAFEQLGEIDLGAFG